MHYFIVLLNVFSSQCTKLVISPLNYCFYLSTGSFCTVSQFCNFDILPFLEDFSTLSSSSCFLWTFSWNTLLGGKTCTYFIGFSFQLCLNFMFQHKCHFFILTALANYSFIKKNKLENSPKVGWEIFLNGNKDHSLFPSSYLFRKAMP